MHLIALVLFAKCAALAPFPNVLALALSNGLPLHVVGLVRPASAKRAHMVNHLARARTTAIAVGRTRVRALELGDRCGAALGGGVGRRDQGQRQHPNSKMPSHLTNRMLEINLLSASLAFGVRSPS